MNLHEMCFQEGKSLSLSLDAVGCQMHYNMPECQNVEFLALEYPVFSLSYTVLVLYFLHSLCSSFPTILSLPM